MTSTARVHRLAVIRGDGIGPEVIDASLEVLAAAESVFGFRTELTEIAAGARHYLATGELFTPALQSQLRAHDAILFGAMGDPAVAPGILERGFILEMRRSFAQAVNLRPVKLYPGVTTPIAGLTPDRCDLVIVRENTEGSYVGRGSTVHAGTPHAVAVQESVNTRMGVERVVEFAFRLAERRGGTLTLCHKKNILVEAGTLWQSTVDDVSSRFSSVPVDYVHVDALCFYLPTAPERFNVVVTDNLFGDIITDLGAAIQGGLGVAASANLNLDGSGPSMFEAIHGSAPDIAGRGWANPIGAVLSTAMCLAHLGEAGAARAIEATAVHVLAQLPATAGPGMGYSTAQLGQEIARLLTSGAPVPVVPGHSVMDDLAALRDMRVDRMTAGGL
ncbi:3-isopropylmalate dehydrogenase [Cryobacterium sp. PH31-O1]|uniref:3-isopropylmalate dehydrogenase n=1 Tax=Cryobacterium sp. PH31-O1 TaxID=3046306 RepID=UPI0024B8AE52|nr:3-isopropylmalate dehydrogenase [Cryobacterium sp. PH31-O1]MDJ0337157.1 3-isopropylmalate dehydrogenase [Cryobacterium sp. PH31-O1]